MGEHSSERGGQVETAEIRKRLEAERRRLTQLTGTLSVPNGESEAEASAELGDYDQHPADIRPRLGVQAAGRLVGHACDVGGVQHPVRRGRRQAEQR